MSEFGQQGTQKWYLKFDCNIAWSVLETHIPICLAEVAPPQSSTVYGNEPISVVHISEMEGVTAFKLEIWPIQFSEQ